MIYEINIDDDTRTQIVIDYLSNMLDSAYYRDEFEVSLINIIKQLKKR